MYNNRNNRKILRRTITDLKPAYNKPYYFRSREILKLKNVYKDLSPYEISKILRLPQEYIRQILTSNNSHKRRKIPILLPKLISRRCQNTFPHKNVVVDTLPVLAPPVPLPVLNTLPQKTSQKLLPPQEPELLLKLKKPRKAKKKPNLLLAKIKRFQSRSECSQPFGLKEFIDKFGNNPVCYLTGESINLDAGQTYHLDHKIPISRSGSSNLDNLGILTAIANRSKSAMIPNEFISLCVKVLENKGYKVSPPL